MKINESTDDVEKLIQFLDKKVIQSRSHKNWNKLSPIINKFYKSVIIPWYELVLDNKIEIGSEEKEVANKILDFASWLDYRVSK